MINEQIYKILKQYYNYYNILYNFFYQFVPEARGSIITESKPTKLTCKSYETHANSTYFLLTKCETN